MPSPTISQFYLVIPAAGAGRRMEQSLPKQYSSVLGVPLIQHTLLGLGSLPWISGILVALAANDHWWPAVEAALPGYIVDKLVRVNGGNERADSVANAMAVLRTTAGQDDWVLVHDSVRPCVTHSDINQLVATLNEHPLGGILATPVRETLKRADAGGGILDTVDRTRLWQAATPQMFRYGILDSALKQCVADKVTVTDEASAVEYWLHSRQDTRQVQLVKGRSDNIKVTFPEDLKLAELILSGAV